MQVLPSKELSPYIKHYLFLDNKETTIQKLRLFSDGNMGVVFSLKSKLISDINNHEIKNYLPGSFLYGQLNSFKDIYSDNEIALVIVVFQPNGINQLLRIPPMNFTMLLLVQMLFLVKKVFLWKKDYLNKIVMMRKLNF